MHDDATSRGRIRGCVTSAAAAAHAARATASASTSPVVSSSSSSRKRPELAAFVRERGDAITAFNPRDRCWFLRRRAVPRSRSRMAARRSRPRAGCSRSTACSASAAYTVVDYNSVICPLQLAAGDGVAHADVAGRDRVDPRSRDRRHHVARRCGPIQRERAIAAADLRRRSGRRAGRRARGARWLRADHRHAVARARGRDARGRDTR